MGCHFLLQNKVTEYINKINTQKFLAFLYINSEKSERGIKETIPFTTATKRTKYLGISWLKKTKDLYAENYKTLMKDIKDNTKRWIHVLGLEDSISWNWLYYSKQIQCNPYQPTNGISVTELEQKISQFVWKHKRPQIDKATLKKKKKSCKNQPSLHPTILQSYSHQDSMVGTENKNTDQWNKTKSPEINPCTYGHLIFDKWHKHIQWRKESLFKKWCCENCAATHERMKLEHLLRHTQK